MSKVNNKDTRTTPGSHRAIHQVVELNSSTEKIHWLLLIHANWTTELEIRLNNDIPEAVREKYSLK